MRNKAISLSLLNGLLLAGCVLPLWSQSEPASAATPPKYPTRQEAAEHFERDGVDQTHPLHYASTQAEQNEILTALRNMVDPQTKIFLVPSSSIIAVHAPVEVQQRVDKLLAALDKPTPRYRLTYTVTELDGTRKIGVQHFSMIALAGQRSQLKQGSRIPISVGEAQSTYIDVGMNFDATVTEIQGGGVLRSRVEQTSIAPESTSPGNPNPIIRQTQLDGTSALLLGKPLLLGSMDVPSSTRHFDVEVVMEPVN